MNCIFGPSNVCWILVPQFYKVITQSFKFQKRKQLFNLFVYFILISCQRHYNKIYFWWWKFLSPNVMFLLPMTFGDETVYQVAKSLHNEKFHCQKVLLILKKTKLLVCLIDTIAIVAIVLFFLFLFVSHWFVLFFSFKYLYELTYILLYLYNKFYNTFTVIETSIFYRSK